MKRKSCVLAQDPYVEVTKQEQKGKALRFIWTPAYLILHLMFTVLKGRWSCIWVYRWENWSLKAWGTCPESWPVTPPCSSWIFWFPRLTLPWSLPDLMATPWSPQNILFQEKSDSNVWLINNGNAINCGRGGPVSTCMPPKSNPLGNCGPCLTEARSACPLYRSRLNPKGKPITVF